MFCETESRDRERQHLPPRRTLSEDLMLSIERNNSRGFAQTTLPQCTLRSLRRLYHQEKPANMDSGLVRDALRIEGSVPDQKGNQKDQGFIALAIPVRPAGGTI